MVQAAKIIRDLATKLLKIFRGIFSLILLIFSGIVLVVLPDDYFAECLLKLSCYLCPSEYIDYFKSKISVRMDSDDEEDWKDKYSKRPVIVDKAGEANTAAGVSEEPASKDKSPSPSYNPSYRRGTQAYHPGLPSAHEELNQRLEKLMLQSTQNFIDQDESEIKNRRLHLKKESELTPDDIALLESRDSHVKHMIKTSAKLLTMESKSGYIARGVPSGDGNINIHKRDVNSADIESDKKEIKKRK